MAAKKLKALIACMEAIVHIEYHCTPSCGKAQELVNKAKELMEVAKNG